VQVFRTQESHGLHVSWTRLEKTVFNSGAAGYVLSRETIKKMVHLWNAGDPLCTGTAVSQWLQSNPALLTTHCMKDRLGEVPIDTRHHQKWKD
jgi:hypothetical protein